PVLRKEQRCLERDSVPKALVARQGGVEAQDEVPFDGTRLPQGELRRLVGMVVEAWVAHPPQAVGIQLGIPRLTCEGTFPMLEGQRVLEDVDQGGLSRQAVFAVDQEMAEARVARLIEHARLTDGGEGAVNPLRLLLPALDPAEHLGRAVPPVVASL